MQIALSSWQMREPHITEAMQDGRNMATLILLAIFFFNDF